MLFNSIDFATFLPIAFGLYWTICKCNLRLQNAFLLIVSYVFYGWWDWRFLSLIVISSAIDYMVGLRLSKAEHPGQRKMLLWVSILVNLGFLGFFKYFNFFAENFASAFSVLGVPFVADRLNIILPVGISFYTFQTLSYTIDVYKRKIEPTQDIIAFFAFVSFFPQLVAGPIERASNLLPQFFKQRQFDYLKAVDGLRQMLWGLFKKVVIADNCAQYVDLIFSQSSQHSGSTLMIGAILFAFQIYGDFSGYSDIAIGTSRLFGFDLMKNFNFPYFSRDIGEFWRRWHISLSTWFRDYLYIPLGGSKGNMNIKIRNTFIIFLVSGFWHGANWTFIVWGAMNAAYFLPLLVLKKNRQYLGTVAEGRYMPTPGEIGRIMLTFLMTTLAWIVFRAENMNHAWNYLAGIFDVSLFSWPTNFPVPVLILIAVLVAVEWLQRDKEHGLYWTETRLPTVFRWATYLVLVYSVLFFIGKDNTFIYFQF
ncbi:MBOAT family O-acyltransferase [Reichenbachiella sp.]